MSRTVCGFAPFCDENSSVLILGSFPSVLSRANNFYYGNPRNAFWKIIADFFGEELPNTLEQKKSLLTNHGIALWDVVTKCCVKGSQDSTISHYEVANLREVFTKSPIKAIIINGSRAYSIFIKNYGGINLPVYKLPSTSPANTRRNDDEWFAALRKAFGTA